MASVEIRGPPVKASLCHSDSIYTRVDVYINALDCPSVLFADMLLHGIEAVILSKNHGAFTEYGFEVHENVASCYIDGAVRLQSTYEMHCANGTEEEVCVFTRKSLGSCYRATRIPPGASAHLRIHRPPHSDSRVVAVRVKPDNPQVQAQCNVVELRVFKTSAITFPAHPAGLQPSDPGPSNASTSTDIIGTYEAGEDFRAPSPDQWQRPHAILRFVYTRRHGNKALSKGAKDIMARARTCNPSQLPAVVLPPVAALLSPENPVIYQNILREINERSRAADVALRRATLFSQAVVEHIEAEMAAMDDEFSVALQSLKDRIQRNLQG